MRFVCGFLICVILCEYVTNIIFTKWNIKC